MKKRWITGAALLSLLFLAACAKKVPDSKKINSILKEEPYIRVLLEESYHQSEVRFDQKNDRAVVPKGAEWGLPKYREKEIVGISFGGEEGADISEADEELNPELYLENYMGLIRQLHLTVGDVRESDYHVKVVKKKQLRAFEEEISLLSGMVIKDSYELTGVEIAFDRKFRPVKKTFQFQKKEDTELDDEEDSAKCTQRFAYGVGKTRFNWSFRQVKKLIENEY